MMFEDVKVEDGRDGEVAVPTVTAYFSFYPVGSTSEVHFPSISTSTCASTLQSFFF
jgi:hypothetical protein